MLFTSVRPCARAGPRAVSEYPRLQDWMRWFVLPEASVLALDRSASAVVRYLSCSDKRALALSTPAVTSKPRVAFNSPRKAKLVPGKPSNRGQKNHRGRCCLDRASARSVLIWRNSLFVDWACNSSRRAGAFSRTTGFVRGSDFAGSLAALLPRPPRHRP